MSTATTLPDIESLSSKLASKGWMPLNKGEHNPWNGGRGWEKPCPGVPGKFIQLYRSDLPSQQKRWMCEVRFECSTAGGFAEFRLYGYDDSSLIDWLRDIEWALSKTASAMGADRRGKA